MNFPFGNNTRNVWESIVDARGYCGGFSVHRVVFLIPANVLIIINRYHSETRITSTMMFFDFVLYIHSILKSQSKIEPKGLIWL